SPGIRRRDGSDLTHARPPRTPGPEGVFARSAPPGWGTRDRSPPALRAERRPRSARRFPAGRSPPTPPPPPPPPPPPTRPTLPPREPSLATSLSPMCARHGAKPHPLTSL